jgi:integrase
LVATAVFSGLRLMELLGLRWCDLDYDAGYIRVRHQLGRYGRLKTLKTTAAERDVVLFPELASLLRRHEAASRFSQPNDFVFASATGTAFNCRNVEVRGFDAAVARAKLGAGRAAKPVFHDCRHTFASLLVSKALDLVFISRQLGHANPAMTLRVYTHLFDKANHADNMRNLLSAQFGGLLDGNVVETAPRNQAKPPVRRMPQLGAVG